MIPLCIKCFSLSTHTFFSVPWIHMAASSGFRFVLSHGTKVDMQIPVPHSEDIP